MRLTGRRNIQDGFHSSYLQQPFSSSQYCDSFVVVVFYPRRMSLNAAWLLLLLSVCAGVWAVPIDRNPSPTEAPHEEEKPEENVVTVFTCCPNTRVSD